MYRVFRTNYALLLHVRLVSELVAFLSLCFIGTHHEAYGSSNVLGNFPTGALAVHLAAWLCVRPTRTEPKNAVASLVALVEPAIR